MTLWFRGTQNSFAFTNLNSQERLADCLKYQKANGHFDVSRSHFQSLPASYFSVPLPSPLAWQGRDPFTQRSFQVRAAYASRAGGVDGASRNLRSIEDPSRFGLGRFGKTPWKKRWTRHGVVFLNDWSKLASHQASCFLVVRRLSSRRWYSFGGSPSAPPWASTVVRWAATGIRASVMAAFLCCNFPISGRVVK